MAISTQSMKAINSSDQSPSSGARPSSRPSRKRTQFGIKLFYHDADVEHTFTVMRFLCIKIYIVNSTARI